MIGKKINGILYRIIVIGTSAYVIYILFLMANACMDFYPREYRDVANSVIALDIAKGINPYLINIQNNIPTVYVYTSLNICIAALIYKLTGVTIYTIFHCLDFLYLCLAVVLIYKMTKNATKSRLMGMLSLPLTLTLGYRYCFIQACPDRLGILILVIILYLIGSYKGRYRLVLLSFFTVLAFYAKQYFLIISLPVFLYVLFHDRKDAFRYFMITAALGFGSLGIINYFCPLFTLETVLLMGVETSKPTASDLQYSFLQMFEFCKRYWCVTIMVFFYYWKLIKNWVKNKKIDIENVHIIVVPVMSIVLLRLGENTGAYLSYHLALLGTSFIILGILGFYTCICQVKEENIRALSEVIMAIIIIITCYHFYPIQNKTVEQKAEWEQAYSILDEYVSDEREMYLDPTLAYYAIDHEKTVYDNGQSFFMRWIESGEIKGKAIDSAAYSKAFPHFYEFEQMSIVYVNDIREKIQNKEYAVIAIIGNELCGVDVTTNYQLLDTVSLQMGTQNFQINIWGVQNDIEKRY